LAKRKKELWKKETGKKCELRRRQENDEKADEVMAKWNKGNKMRVIEARGKGENGTKSVNHLYFLPDGI